MEINDQLFVREMFASDSEIISNAFRAQGWQKPAVLYHQYWLEVQNGHRDVLIRFQRMGIGTILMREAEWRIAQLSPIAGIGVGLLAGYGAAQVLYIKRGYIPDRRGIIYQNRQLNYGDQVMVDDDLVLYFTRNVK